MKQTAVEWFYQRILAKDMKEVFEQAKQIEKEQIKDSYDAGVWEVGCRNADSDEYYKETYGNGG